MNKWKKVIALFCAITLLVSMNSSVETLAVTEQNSQTESLPTDFTVITPETFGITDGTYTDVYDQTSTITSMDHVMLNADVTFVAGSQLTYGMRNLWQGIRFCALANGKLQFVVTELDTGAKFEGYEDTTLLLENCYIELDPAVAFAGEKDFLNTFNFKITTEAINHDNDTEKDDLKLGLWFDDKLYNDTYFYAIDGFACMGAQMRLANLEMKTPEIVYDHKQPDYKKITLEHFGIEDNQSLTDAAVYGTDTSLANLDKTVFTATINFQDGYRFCYGSGVGTHAAATWESPFVIWMGNGGKLYMSPNNRDVNTLNSQMQILGMEWSDLQFESDKAGIDIAEGVNIDLTITTEFLTDGSGDVRVGIWFKDKLYNNQYFVFTTTQSYAGITGAVAFFGTGIRLSASTGTTNFACKSQKYHIPEGLTAITIENFQLEEGILHEERGVYTDCLQNTLLDMNVKYTELSTYLTYGGKITSNTNVWDGIQFVLDSEGVLHINGGNLAAGKINLMIKPEDLGYSSFLYQKFNLKISVRILDLDGDGEDTDMELGLLLNDNLYNNRFIYVEDVLEKSATYQLGEVLACPAGSIRLYGKKDATTKPVVKRYDLADGAYIVSAITDRLQTGIDVNFADMGTVTVNGNKATNGDTITTPGVYDIVRTDALTGEMEAEKVVLWRTGYANDDDTIDVRDIVSMKKILTDSSKGTESECLGADINYDKVVNHTDLGLLREILLERYEVDETKNTSSLSYEEDVMPIMGYEGPRNSYQYVNQTHGITATTTNFMTEYYYQLIKDCGINLIVSNNLNASEASKDKYNEVIEALELAWDVGIGMLVSDSVLSSYASYGNYNQESYPAMSDATFASRLSLYSRYPSFRGFLVVDEPYGTTPCYPLDQNGVWGDGVNNRRTIPFFADSMKRTNNFTNVTGYTNLFPRKYWMKSTIEEYAQYVEEYCSTSNPKQLSFDYYLFPANKAYDSVYENYFLNLKVIREAADKYNIPFWSYIQAGSQFNDSGSLIASTRYSPTQGEFLWNVNTTLASGAKGIGYFPMIQPYKYSLVSQTERDYDRNSLIAADGSTTVWYDYAKKANTQIAAVDEILMNASFEKLLAVGTESQKHTDIQETTHEQLISVLVSNDTKGTVIGVFDYQGKTVLYVVNYDRDSEQTITLNFQSPCKMNIIMNGVQTTAEDDRQQLTLEAGGAALVLIQ